MRRLSTVLFLLIARTAAAQDDAKASLAGRVLDSLDSGAVASAKVQIVGTSLTALTDGRGNFRIGNITAGVHEYSVRAIGYQKTATSHEFASGALQRDIYLERLPNVLTQMVVQGRSLRVPRFFEAIYARGSRWGTFITREQIDSLNPFDLRTVLRSVPGLLVTDRRTYFHFCPADQVGELWMDGRRMGAGEAIDEWLTNIPPKDVQAIEVYARSQTIPADFLMHRP
ncbi:MAG TPA: TonB-dependent receptor, partial [Gemmatimonadaceae bacterium]|nr:TonB-dependent receptor [Gemmatimonadaceae bacterium]